jgi:uncharacterized membrane protein YccC
MTSHVLTVALLLAALALYAVGMQEGGALLFLMGAVLEFGFWLRVLRSRPDGASAAASLERESSASK